MTSRQTAVPAREPAPGSGAGESAPGSGAGDSPPGTTRQPALGGDLHGPALARLLLTALLIAAVLVGLRGGFTLHGWRGPYRRDGIAIGIALEAVLAALIAALLVLPTILLLAKPLHGHPLPSPQPQPNPTTSATPAVTRGTRPGSAFHVPLTGILYVLLVLALIAGIVVCVVLLRRRPPGLDAEPPEASVAEGQRGDLREAVSSGRRALADLDDARAAIIACYVAMERSLAAAGADQEAADTPDEFLGRAVAAGLVRGRAAGVLARLFYEARYSAHEMTPAQRDAA